MRLYYEYPIPCNFWEFYRIRHHLCPQLHRPIELWINVVMMGHRKLEGMHILRKDYQLPNNFQINRRKICKIQIFFIILQPKSK